MDNDLSLSAPAPAPRLSRSVLLRLLALAKPYRLLLGLAGGLMLVSTAISLSLPLVARAALDRVLATHDVRSLDRLAVALAGLILLSTLLSFAEFLLVAFAGNRIVLDMRARLFGHLQRLPIRFFDRTRSGELASRLANDVTLLQSTLTDDLVRLTGHLVTLCGGIGLAVVIDWRLTAVVFTLLASILALFFAFGAQLRKYTRESLDALSDAMGSMTEALGNIRLVKAFAREAYEETRTREKLQQVFRLVMRSSAFEAGLGSVAGTGFLGVLLGVVWYGGRSVLTGSLSAGSLLAFLMTVTIISGPMASLAGLYGRLQRAAGAAERLFAILDDTPEPSRIRGAAAFPAGPAEITFQDVVFAYQPDTPVLRGLTLHVPAGRTTALVGVSGAGKTTVAALLYRFYAPDAGAIRINGIPVEEIALQDLRNQIGLVPQDPHLFNGTIRENIRYGRLNASDAEVQEAARAANVEEFVSALPHGYDTVIGERGVTLSGGQRQRVAIARVILKDPPIRILDEATSALDAHAEALVREALERLMYRRTTLVIAHRLTTVRDADQIAVLAEGSIAETGSHEQLLRANGRYAHLYSLHAG